MKEEIPEDFSGIISHLTAEPTVVEAAPEVVPSSSSLGKRKRAEYETMVIDDFVITVTDQSLSSECLIADHDYVTKKPKLDGQVTPLKVSHVTSTIQSGDEALASKPLDKYRERRDKNNEASRRSRLIRKQKYQEMDQEANELEVKNEALRKKIVELEALAKTMKAILIKKMTEK